MFFNAVCSLKITVIGPRYLFNPFRTKNHWSQIGWKWVRKNAIHLLLVWPVIIRWKVFIIIGHYIIFCVPAGKLDNGANPFLQLHINRLRPTKRGTLQETRYNSRPHVSVFILLLGSYWLVLLIVSRLWWRLWSGHWLVVWQSSHSRIRWLTSSSVHASLILFPIGFAQLIVSGSVLWRIQRKIIVKVVDRTWIKLDVNWYLIILNLVFTHYLDSVDVCRPSHSLKVGSRPCPRSFAAIG